MAKKNGMIVLTSMSGEQVRVTLGNGIFTAGLLTKFVGIGSGGLNLRYRRQ